MSQPQTIEGTGEELGQYLKQRPHERFRLIPVSLGGSRPFYETATAEEWIEELYSWASRHDPRIAPLSDEAISRDSIYEGRG